MASTRSEPDYLEKPFREATLKDHLRMLRKVYGSRGLEQTSQSVCRFVGVAPHKLAVATTSHELCELPNCDGQDVEISNQKLQDEFCVPFPRGSFYNAQIQNIQIRMSTSLLLRLREISSILLCAGA